MNMKQRTFSCLVKYFQRKVKNDILTTFYLPIPPHLGLYPQLIAADKILKYLLVSVVYSIYHFINFLSIATQKKARATSPRQIIMQFFKSLRHLFGYKYQTMVMTRSVVGCLLNCTD